MKRNQQEKKYSSRDKDVRLNLRKSNQNKKGTIYTKLKFRNCKGVCVCVYIIKKR